MKITTHEPDWVLMEAKFDGTCKTCGFPIEIGEMMYWKKGSGSRCNDCGPPVYTGVGVKINVLKLPPLKFTKPDFSVPSDGSTVTIPVEWLIMMKKKAVALSKYCKAGDSNVTSLINMLDDISHDITSELQKK